MEHVVHPLILMGTLQGDDVLGVGHYAHGVLVPPGRAAQRAQPLPLGEVLALGAVADAPLGLEDGVGKGLCLLLRAAQHVQGQTLGALTPHAGQFCKLFH